MYVSDISKRFTYDEAVGAGEPEPAQQECQPARPIYGIKYFNSQIEFMAIARFMGVIVREIKPEVHSLIELSEAELASHFGNVDTCFLYPRNAAVADFGMLHQLVIIGNDSDWNSAFRFSDREPNNRSEKRVRWLLRTIVKV